MRIQCSKAMTLAMVVGALVTTAGCGGGEASSDECVPRCGAGQVCHLGECVPAGSVSVPCEPECLPHESCRSDGTCRPLPQNLLDCQQIRACASSCQDAGCVQDCRAEGGYFAKQTFDTLLECQAAYCPEGEAACMADKCADQLADCAGTLGECGEVGAEGGCSGSTLLECVSGQVQQTDCGQLQPGCTCAFDTGSEAFGCTCQGGGGGCVPACPPGQGCYNGSCVPIGDDTCNPPCPAGSFCFEGKCNPNGGGGGEACPADLPEGASRCQGTVAQSCAFGQLSEQDCQALGCSCGFDDRSGASTCCPNQDF